MFTTIYVLLLAVVLLLPALLLYLYDKKQKRLEKQKLYQHLAQAAQLHQLSFTSQEEFGSLVFGLDGIKRKMLVVEKRPPDSFSIQLIDLAEVRSCAVRKHFAALSGTTFGNGSHATEPSAISLVIFANAQPPIEMMFYSSDVNRRRDAALLERKAKDWEQLLLKMVMPLERRA